MTTIKEPREGYVQIAGIPWMARMIDKARLEAAGQIEALDLEYPCPMDQRLLQELGLDGKTFQQIAINAQTDDEIIEALKKRKAILT